MFVFKAWRLLDVAIANVAITAQLYSLDKFPSPRALYDSSKKSVLNKKILDSFQRPPIVS